MLGSIYVCVVHAAMSGVVTSPSIATRQSTFTQPDTQLSKAMIHPKDGAAKDSLGKHQENIRRGLVRLPWAWDRRHRPSAAEAYALTWRDSTPSYEQTWPRVREMSALPPNSDRESGFPKNFMSALPPKADMCGSTRDVRWANSGRHSKTIAI